MNSLLDDYYKITENTETQNTCIFIRRSTIRTSEQGPKRMQHTTNLVHNACTVRGDHEQVHQSLDQLLSMLLGKPTATDVSENQ
jgi:hypothetical protein